MKPALIVVSMLLLVANVLAEPVTIPNGSVVVVRADNQLTSGQLSTGQELILLVSTDVLIKKKTVIAAGAPVHCFVQEATGGQMAGIAGKLVISMNSTVAVDGTSIPLTGQFSNAAKSEVGATVAVGVILCPLALLNSGDDGTIPVGAQSRAITVGTFDVIVE
jgi:hypothetical protein